MSCWLTSRDLGFAVDSQLATIPGGLTDFSGYNCLFSRHCVEFSDIVHRRLSGKPTHVGRIGSGVELRILDYENPGSNPVLRC